MSESWKRLLLILPYLTIVYNKSLIVYLQADTVDYDGMNLGGQ